MKYKDLEMGITWVFCKSDLSCWYIFATQSNGSDALVNIAHNSCSRGFVFFCFFFSKARSPSGIICRCIRQCNITYWRLCYYYLCDRYSPLITSPTFFSFPPEDVSEHLASFRFLVPCHLTALLWWLLGPPTPLQTLPCFYTHALWFLTAGPEDLWH